MRVLAQRCGRCRLLPSLLEQVWQPTAASSMPCQRPRQKHLLLQKAVRDPFSCTVQVWRPMPTAPVALLTPY
ncbi:hypothetical protein WJX72_011114 [[Myrmecia] bisecta]|uniref:Uncharacterized protein n=1 Tax=[Myrmecia] bisecta TaxID=41462 RepID=A0AAW1QSM5_9CHLO